MPLLIESSEAVFDAFEDVSGLLARFLQRNPRAFERMRHGLKSVREHAHFGRSADRDGAIEISSLKRSRAAGKPLHGACE